MTLLDSFTEQVRLRPDAVAVRQGGTDLTYAELAAQSENLAQWLRRTGVRRGDRVVLLLSNSAEYVSCYVAILRAGGVVVALNPELGNDELLTILNDCQPVVALLPPERTERGETLFAGCQSLKAVASISAGALPELQCDRTTGDGSSPENETPPDAVSGPPQLSEHAQIIYTSGTTGRPKGVTLTHRNLAANCRSIIEYLELTERDSVLVVLPFFYSYGNSLLITHLAVGGRLVLASDFVFWNRVLKQMQDEEVTGFAGVPSTFSMLLHRSDLKKRTFSSLRYVTCAGGGLPGPVTDQLREALPGVDVFLMYGQTEATARLSTLLPDEIDERRGSIGRGIPGVTLQVLDEDGNPVRPGDVGEIVARGENIMHGYWNDPAGTRAAIREEGLRTGDLATVDDDGYIYIVGRKSDMIKRGAYRISPHDIEDVLLRCDAVAEAAVVGQPDDIWGEQPVAYVVRSPGQPPITEDELNALCREALPRFKRPHAIRFVNELPKTASGKIRRSVLRDLPVASTNP